MAGRGSTSNYYSLGDYDGSASNESKTATADAKTDEPLPPPKAFDGESVPSPPSPAYGSQQHMPPPPSYQPNFGQWDEKPSFDQAFKVEKPQYHDIWAGILFIVTFGGFVAVSAISISAYASAKDVSDGAIYGGSDDFGLNNNTLILFVFCLLVALVAGFAYVCLARIFTKYFIWTTGILNIILSLGTAIFMLIHKYWSGGLVFGLCGIISILCFWSWISRIPFSVLMFHTVVDVSRHYGHVYLVSFIGGLTAIAFAAWFSVTMVAVYVKYEPGNNPSCSASGSCSSAKVIGLLVFITFAAFWFTEWLKNTIHVTISGVYGSWFFVPHNPPRGATRGASRRALTYSFGSISFGSLILAILHVFRELCNIAMQAAENSPVAFLYYVFAILLALLDAAAEFFNRYAYSYVALYGKSYMESARGTWRLIKDRGIDAAANQCLINTVFSMGAILIAYLCALVAYIYLHFTAPAYNAHGDFTPVIVAYAFLIGLQITNCFTVPLSAGIDTLFVAMAWDPEVLMREHPELYQQMVEVFPKVQEAIHA